MGKSSKPLNIHLDTSLFDAHRDYWLTLQEQGFVLTIVDGKEIDMYIAPHAMRITADMITALPSTITLAIKGARELRYAPHGKGAEKGKPKVAKDKKPRKGKNSTKQAKSPVTGTASDAESYNILGEHTTRFGSATVEPASEGPNIGGDPCSTL